jgi:hypothetical protein
VSLDDVRRADDGRGGSGGGVSDGFAGDEGVIEAGGDKAVCDAFGEGATVA